MAFQRSYSKVWWGSEHQLPGSSFTGGGYYCSSNFDQQQQQQQQRQQQFDACGAGYHSLDFNNFKSYPGNLSRIQEVDDEQNATKLSWEKRDSPGSLRSQDSGFSDNDESHSTRSVGGHSLKVASPSAKSQSSDHSQSELGSPTSARISIATPPTVIRRVDRTDFYSPLVSVSRRISFCGSPASEATNKAEQQQSLTASTSSNGTLPKAEVSSIDDTDACSIDEVDQQKEQTNEVCVQKRRRRLGRRNTRPLTPTKRRTLLRDSTDEQSDTAQDGDEPGKEMQQLNETTLSVGSPMPTYNNETVYLGEAPPPYNNETILLGGDITVQNSSEDTLSPLRQSGRYTASTSTPKGKVRKAKFIPHAYENPLLNGHTPALQSWLDGMRLSYEHEVMFTLQTKSIVQEAFKNLTITTNTVAKLIRQLQQRAMDMQSMFERVERVLSSSQPTKLNEALSGAEQLVDSVSQFTGVLERRAVFFAESRADRRKYDDHIAQMRVITKDTRYSLERHHYINLESLLDDVQVLKRYLLLAVRLVFEKMVQVIVQSIEQGRCDLMLRANINMVATLMNIDYEGFASLTDAFVQNEAVRTLLIVCLEHKLSSVRALALRALSTICCAPEPIMQLGACGGIEILRDILQVQAPRSSTLRGGAEPTRSETERREAVSLLTQITAAWHGPEHRVDGLKGSIETLVEGLTQLIVQSNCPQTLLLCAAALNNFTRIEITSHYSIMSNEAIFRLIEAIEQEKQDGISIFFYEQVVTMLHNMSLNKKCHSHLANGTIVNFITSVYQAEFYKNYGSRAESEAQRRTVKAILHTVTRLVHDSTLGVELLEQQRIPAFLRLANVGDQLQLVLDSAHDRDMSQLARQLLLAQVQEQKGAGASEAGVLEADATSRLKFNLTRHESFV